MLIIGNDNCPTTKEKKLKLIVAHEQMIKKTTSKESIKKQASKQRIKARKKTRKKNIYKN
jgi:hypothetical protein